jgi:hypothetical protein
MFWLESLSVQRSPLIPDKLKVRKAGLPPALCFALSLLNTSFIFGQESKHPTFNEAR